jgi:hypothetical protein
MSSFRRTKKLLISILLIAIIGVSVFALQQSHPSAKVVDPTSIPYVGIAFCGNTTAEAKTLIDRTKSYTNLFILDTGRNAISQNESAVYEVCDYAAANGLSLIINFGMEEVVNVDRSTWFWHQPLDGIKQNWTERWGEKFLGIYYSDEPGGAQLDANWTRYYSRSSERLSQSTHPVMQDLYGVYLKMRDYADNGTKPQNYDLETQVFVYALTDDPGIQHLKAAGIRSFTSDYGLYWFDYLGGYDVMLTQLGWNASVAQQIALVKGAARLQDKEWGAIITWKYNTAPFLDSGDEIYNQMLTAYQAGAKYITIFNYAFENGTSFDAMTDEHYIALERFWNDIHQKSFEDLSTPKAALVLPHNYGWGMRSPNDTIWGFWPPDEKTEQTGTIMGKLLAKYGAALDIVFEDEAYPMSKAEYEAVYYWNQTI